ncbi:hypothetical protein K402DRAFT_333162 [Aulographum hederae CBS 113979]|uniref:Intracellular protein transport protein n=1 Tax=Aulographum hederae CBS 113979 TaxID=1176131 RepID=A0A6G1GZB2_9PEZI|nr:hypothetical protein K402DRAFT_333162 [Aulographum hederae CBS 113979]
MLRALEAQAPVKQSATETITTLSGRLNNATLLEDRRAAIQGLRSFAKEYPASVASSSLRGLINSLTQDAEDVDTIKLVLETLKWLLNPNEQSVEPSQDIVLWIADEFSQRQENMNLLLDFLESSEFFARLQSVQLLASIASARPERTVECFEATPSATPRLAAMLDDQRDAIRNAAILLLIDITQNSQQLQGVVGSTDAFESIFALVEAEGSLAQGGLLVQDCLVLLSNLIRGHKYNQYIIREFHVSKLARMLASVSQGKALAAEEQWISPQKDMNTFGLLAVLRMFLVVGMVGTQLNQNAFQKYGLLQQLLSLAFDKSTAPNIRAEALYTCADLIKGNQALQEGFAQYEVMPMEAHNGTNGATNGVSKLYVIEALLKLILSPSSVSMFDARYAACECIKAYMYKHNPIRIYFLQRAIEGHATGNDGDMNALTILLPKPETNSDNDPYRAWFASVLILHLIYEDPEAKGVLMKVTDGNEEQGEDVVTCIQSISANLVRAIQHAEDERIATGYLMLLCGWLYESAEAVNDFLSEGSSVLRVFAQTAAKSTRENALLRGLCAALLGIVYEFSTKDSPVTRKEVQSIVMSDLEREHYLDALAGLRQHPLLRDFEVLPQNAASAPEGALPDVYFDQTFVELLKDNFSRIRKSFDRDPGLEVHATAGAVDRDVLDTLRTQIEDKSQALQDIESQLLTLESKLHQEQDDRRRDQEQSAAEIARIANINDSLQKNHDAQVQRLQTDANGQMQNMDTQFRAQLDQLNAQLRKAQETHQGEMKRTTSKYDKELGQLQKDKTELEKSLSHSRTSRDTLVADAQRLEKEREEINEKIEAAHQKIIASEEKRKTADTKLQEVQKKSKDLEGKLKSAQDKERAKKAASGGKGSKDTKELDKKIADLEKALKEKEAAIKEKEEAQSSTQSELDSMFLILEDLGNKRDKDKKRLKELGEEVSEGEDDDEEEEDESEDGEAEDGDLD